MALMKKYIGRNIFMLAAVKFLTIIFMFPLQPSDPLLNFHPPPSHPHSRCLSAPAESHISQSMCIMSDNFVAANQ